VRTSAPPAPIVSHDDVVREIHRLFDAGPDAGLVIRVYGEAPGDGGDADATFREMLASLRMYDERFGQSGPVTVQAPTRASLNRAMSVLGREEHQRKILGQVLTTFGRRLLDPLGDQLDPRPEGSTMSRLGLLRDMFLAQARDLKLTPESQQILEGDLRKLLTDDYLAMVAEHEERVQRPRVTHLAQEVLRMVGGTFRRALSRWPQHADGVASAIARRVQGEVHLRDIPTLLRDQITNGIEEYLWVETSTEIQGALRSLFAEHHGAVTVDPAPLEREAYRDFARACWQIIADNC
jgi:hypothetical protein